jgi:hypothetical protein
MSIADLRVFLGMRVPGGTHPNGAPLFLGPTKRDHEAAIPLLVGAVPFLRARVVMLRAQYGVAVGFYQVEAQHLFNLFAARDLGPLDNVPGVRSAVTCGVCSLSWTSATYVEVLMHSCSGVNMHPGVIMPAMPVVVAAQFIVSPRYRPGFLRAELLRDTVVGLFREYIALQRVESLLGIYS